MNSIYNLFNRAIKWNAFEAFTYQTILTIHQILLFSITDRLAYGLFGTLFSLLYLLILILNFGLDKSLVPFFMLFTKSRLHFKKIFVSQFIIQLIFLFLISFSLIIFNKSFCHLFSSSFKCSLIPTNFIYILSALILLEATKKTLRVVAQLAFLNRETAIIEICSILIYVSLVWLGYFHYKTINIYIVFLPLLIESIFVNACFLFFIIKIYLKLPKSSECNLIENNQNILSRIIKSRAENYSNQVSHLFFSTNFLIPYLSYTFGLAEISILKLINYISISFTIILERTFGLTSGALLTHLKNFPNKVKQEALNLATKKLYIILYGILIFFIITFKAISNKYLLNNNDILSSYFFLLIIIFENFFITYEEFFLVEEKIYYLFFLNSITSLTFYGLLQTISLPLYLSLLLLLFIRFIMLIIMRIISIYKLKVSLPYKIDLKYIVIYFAFALIYLIVVK